MQLLVSSILIFLCTCDLSSSADPVLQPKEVSDVLGNRANEDSNITWSELPKGKSYKQNETKFEDKGLQPYFNLVNSFLKTTQPKTPLHEILDYTEGNSLDIQNVIKEYGVGIIICGSLGILFVIFMPIIGLCFCCCRLCGNCGGKRIQNKGSYDRVKVIIFSALLVIFTAFIGTSAACVIATSEYTTDAINSLYNIISNDYDDLNTFLENVVDETNHATKRSFDFAGTVINRDLDNVGYLMGIPLRNHLGSSSGANVDNSINNIKNLDPRVDELEKQMSTIKNNTDSIKPDGTNLEASLLDMRNKIAATKAQTGACLTSCQALDQTLLTMEVDYNLLPDITTDLIAIRAVQAQDIAKKADQTKQIFFWTGVKNQLSNFSKILTDLLENINKLPQDASENLDDSKKDVLKYLDYAKDYNPYRRYVGFGFGGIIALIGCLILFGLLCGLLGYNHKTSPVDRSSLSNHGGNTLISSTAFIFIFTPLFMLITTILYLIAGAMTQRIVCDVFTDSEMTGIKVLLDGPRSIFGKNKYYLGEMFLQNDTVPLTFSGVLSDCKLNTAAFTALKLDRKFDLDTASDYKKSIDIEGEINKMQVDLSNIEIMNQEMEDLLNAFHDSLNINYNGYINELSKSTTRTDLGTFATQMENSANDGQTINPAKDELLAYATQLKAIYNTGTYATAYNNQNQLLRDVVQLQTDKTKTQADIKTAINTAKASNNYFPTQSDTDVKNAASNYGKRIVHPADQYKKQAVYSMRTDVGRCSTIYNVWDSLFNIGLCHYFTYSVNGFWFGIGWAIFFMIPSVIFGVKLAKHFRKMRFENIHSQPNTNQSLPMQNDHIPTQNNKGPPFKNKVSHTDGPVPEAPSQQELYPNLKFKSYKMPAPKPLAREDEWF
ncbi:DgyrCDS2245 [Dimorphilus gyrociliatus]|uniref:DgyrCDS2245 n=1 Tax=Dimorphilus gyrociliatus TaxID=2664684 RepID=A0A7I8V9N5_9ANNE|nr:DgyrCDS2245 [Dimorphilus gyrociliatus]